ncbi:MAG: hypothetical protein LCH84_02635 [Gemmatimonadetes bacterium]|nr:hypothetical protein [Gemmatimonadota bacterium]
MSASPRLTVVVPSVNGLHDLVPCCEALARVHATTPIAVLVVDRLGATVTDVVRARWPWMQVLSLPAGTTIPEMRHAAFSALTTEAIAVIEDHVILPPTWAQAALAALDEGLDVVAGPIENAANERLLDWSTFLCEYHACLPPLPEGPSTWLPGNSIVYRRTLLERYRAVTAEGKWENRLHDALRADGVRLEMRTALAVGHKKHFGFFEYISQRWLYSRSYAGARVAGAPLVKRLATGAAALALPAVMFLRVEKTLAAKGVAAGRLLATMPFIAVYCVSWGLGEVAGYWLGAGDALARVR